MGQQIPFQPTGKTFVANVSGTVNTINVVSDAPSNQLRFYCPSADIVARFGNSAGNSIVSLPVVGIPAYGMPVVSGSAQIFTVGPTTNVTVSMTSTLGNSGVSLVYITPGEGLQ